MTTPRDTLAATPRDTVRHLADQALSNREIARRTGVSEATVRRWRKADAPPTRDDAPAETLTMPLDEELRAHLDVLAASGVGDSEAVALCLRFVAAAVADAWDHQICPRGMLPTMRIRSLHPNAPWPP